MSINRFDCRLHVENMPKRKIEKCEETDEHFVFENNTMQILISKKTGLIDKYCVNGKDLLRPSGAKISAFKDNEDPWGMTGEGFNEKIGEFTLLSDEKTNAFNGYPDATHPNVRIIENGAVRLKIQAIFGYSDSFAVITYSIPKNGNDIDIKIKILSNDSSKFYKLSFETAFDSPEFRGQTAFGREKHRTGGKEAVYQKWCGLFENSQGFAILNKGTYGGSVDGNSINISLLRTPVYSAHPIGDRPLADDDRCHDRIDIGEREFEFRLTADIDTLDMQADIFNQPCIALSFFPSGSGEKKETRIELGNTDIILTRYRKNENGIIIRLFNSSDKSAKTKFTVENIVFEIEFGAFEVKTFSYDCGSLVETDMI